MPSIYAVVFHDPKNRGFEKVANDSGGVLIGRGYRPLYQTNETPCPLSEIENSDFEVEIKSQGRVLEPLSAFDETPSAAVDAKEKLRELIEAGSNILSEMNARYGCDDSDHIAASIKEACDGWDALVQAIDPEPTLPVTYPGICWPCWADNTCAPEGWSWVERDDEADLYKTDLAAAFALVDKHRVPATTIKWFNRYSHEPAEPYASGASVAIDIPEPEEGE